jgi:hypothetical protein
MERAIPDKIVAALNELAESLATWCSAGRDGSLQAHEEAVLARVRAVLPTLVQAVVEVATSGLDPRLARARTACPSCGRKVRPHQVRPRQVMTQGGLVTLAVPWYTCARCGHGWSVLETTLAVEPRQRLSAGLRAWLVRLGATTDYREAAELLDTLTHLAVSPETIRRECVRVGSQLVATEAAAIAQTHRTREAAEPVETAPGLLVVEADGANILFTDGWHEVKIGMVAGWQEHRLVGPSYVAAREPVGDFGPRLATEAARRGALAIERWAGEVTGRGLAILRPTMLLGDGAPWIWGLADEYFDQRIEAVDFWHAGQHLYAAAHALFGETAQATAWAEARKADLLAVGPAPVLAAFDRATPPSPKAAEIRRVERDYFAKRVDQLDYPSLRLDGLPIGSGAIESAADHVVQRRMKRAGMRWSPTGGQAILTLRARLRSGRPIGLPRPTKVA